MRISGKPSSTQPGRPNVSITALAATSRRTASLIVVRTPLNVADYARVPLLNPDQKVKDWREKLPALEHEYERTARLFAAAYARRDEVGSPVSEAEARLYETYLVRAREAIDHSIGFTVIGET